MRLTILALGSRGDVQPFVPLGQALQAAGHTVTVATFADFAPMLTAAGLGFYPVAGDAQALLRQAAQGGGLTKGLSPLQAFRALQRSYGQLAKQLPRELAALPPTELLLNQLPAHLFGYEIAQKQGIPWAIVAVIPIVRTRLQPLVGMPQLGGLPGYNFNTYRFGEQMGWHMFRAAINHWRVSLGLRPWPWWGYFEQLHRDRIPFICGFSSHVVPRPPDWGDHVHLTGWWYPTDPEWTPPVELQRFLDSGPPPVFLGFGSMPVPDPAATTALLVEAVQRSGQRAILHAGWAGLGPAGQLPANIYKIDYAPYGWLFPRLASIVHHGGSGTTGFALASGVPSLVVPFAFDQFYWGARTAALGVGPAPLPFRHLRAEALAAALHQMAHDSALRAQAATLGPRLRAEGGVQAAVRHITRLRP